MRVQRVFQNRRVLSAVVFGVWLTIATVAASAVTSWHSVALPQADTGGLQLTKADGQWHIRHYLSPDCACSRAVAQYLVGRGPVSQAIEDVVLIDSGIASAEDHAQRERQMPDSLNHSHFPTRMIDAGAAATTARVEAVPTLEITGPEGLVRFHGGYRDPAAPAGTYMDVRILTDLRLSRPVAGPRIFGCATSARLRRKLNPFFSLMDFFRLS